MLESVLDRSLRKARRDARDLLDEARPLLKRHGARVEQGNRVGLEQLRDELASARKGKDTAQIATLTGKLNDGLEKHLGKVRKSPTRLWIESMVRAVLVVAAIRVLIIEPFMIPSGSMLPTLQIGDHIFVSKFIYGVRVPFINYQLIQGTTPRRGDVIVFNHPLEPDKDLIKRVAGVPGDVITLEDEVVKINGVPQPRELKDGSYSFWDYRQAEGGNKGFWFQVKGQQLYEEKLGDKLHAVLQRPDVLRPRASEGPFIVPPRSVFVLGDNRDDSADGRFYGGWYVPYGNIKGKALFVWLSVGKGGWWLCHDDNLLCPEGGIRFNRFFHVIH